MKGLFITGTDTDVGKTYISCLIAAELHSRNINVVPRKPVESGCQREAGELIPHDATTLKQAANYTGSLQQVCPYRFEQAISPQRAAQLNNQTLHINDLADACTHGVDINNDFLLVEGAGGFYSPLCEDGLNADLAQSLNLPVLLVAEDKVGCINQVLLTLQAIHSRQLNIHAIILNRSTDSTTKPLMNNREDLIILTDTPVLTADFRADRLSSNTFDNLPLPPVTRLK